MGGFCLGKSLTAFHSDVWAQQIFVKETVTPIGLICRGTSLSYRANNWSIAKTSSSDLSLWRIWDATSAETLLGKSSEGICAKGTTGSQPLFLENLTSSSGRDLDMFWELFELVCTLNDLFPWFFLCLEIFWFWHPHVLCFEQSCFVGTFCPRERGKEWKCAKNCLLGGICEVCVCSPMISPLSQLLRLILHLYILEASIAFSLILHFYILEIFTYFKNFHRFSHAKTNNLLKYRQSSGISHWLSATCIHRTDLFLGVISKPPWLANPAWLWDTN